MNPDETDLPEVYLQPGEAHLARSPSILKTVLGSCVGVTFWVERSGMGALCHGVLPHCPSGIGGADGYRYVDFAIADLVRRLEQLGARHDELEIKVFGGADVLPVGISKFSRETVGHLNWNAALEVIQSENLNVLTGDLGGYVGRTIEFHTGTGEVLMRRLSRLVTLTEEWPTRRRSASLRP
jgi:chemotaxis protein CheD